MTLKEKFKKIDIKLSKNHSTLVTDREADIMEQIADEFAIGFADWININYFVYNTWDESKTTKELLEIYKKEKGL